MAALTPGLAVVALGGNALVRDAAHQSIPDQYAMVQTVAPFLAELVEAGWGLVITHGNGPQVGFILRRSEIARDEVAPVPIDYAVGDTQGAMGYMFQKAVGNELRRRGLSRPVVTVVTQTVVDAADPAFAHPDKPVGSFLDEATARRRAAELGWTVTEDAGRGWRRTVPSPRPLEIVELDVVARLLGDGAVVIAAGGGGIPVVRTPDDRGGPGDLVGVEAVVDKDRASALLAAGLGTDLLAMVTGVDRVAVDFGRPTQRWLDRLDLDEARALGAAGTFGEGSMRPKVEAIVGFLEQRPGAAGLVTSPECLPAALRGEAGTRFTGAG
jgi:carbamate kinase